MAFINKRKRSAVYWPSILSDGYPVAGPMGETYEVILVRWQDIQEKFIDLEGREDVSRAVIYPYPQLNLGGFIMEVSDPDNLPIGPQYVQEYPPKVPYTIEEVLEYWKFNETINGEKGNDFDITSGSAGYVDGVAGKCISTDGDTGYTLDSQSDLSINGDQELTISLWLKSDAEILDNCIVNILIANNLLCKIQIGSTDSIEWGNFDLSNKSLYTPSSGWASEFINLIFTWRKGEIQDIYINAVKQTLDSQTIYNTLLVDNSITLSTSVTGCNVDIDELRIYNSVLSQKDIQTIAAVHPSQYKLAFEIRQSAKSSNLRGTKWIYKQWLKSKE